MACLVTVLQFEGLKDKNGGEREQKFIEHKDSQNAWIELRITCPIEITEQYV